MAVPHFLVPFQYDLTGSAATVEQDAVAEIAQSVRVLLGTATGTRIEEMDYGMPDPTFRDLRTAPAAIAAAIRRWEPRAVGSTITVTARDDGSAVISAALPAVTR